MSQPAVILVVDDPASLRAGLEAGADDFLTKPVNAATLRARVRTIIRLLRDDPVTAHIPAPALSASAVPLDIQKGLEARFFRYLTKPIQANDFMDKVNTALEFGAKKRGEAQRQGDTHDQFIRHPEGPHPDR